MTFELGEHDKQEAYNGLTMLTAELHQAQIAKGFWDSHYLVDEDGTPLFNLDQKLLLIAGEVIEAHEEFRSNPNINHVYYREDGKPEGLAFELADVFIRLADLSAALGIDLGAVVKEKHEFNQTRPPKHGRLF